jgi:hypothetical protein
MKRKDAERRRNRAIADLRATGMSDEEIAAALGTDTLADETEKDDSAIPVDADGVIDVEFVELSDSGAMREPPAHLPAVIPQTIGANQDSQMNPEGTDQHSRKSEEWWQERSPEVQARRCVAHKKTGERCKQVAIAGARVCRFHGGASKHVKAAARARLENATDLMAKQLLRMAIDDNVADAVKLSAIKDALDRGGLRAPTEVVLSPGDTPAYEEVFEGIYSGSRDDSRAGRTQSIDSQQDWSQSESLADSIGMPPAPAMSQDAPEQTSPFVTDPDSDRPPAPQADERAGRRQSQRDDWRNHAHGLSDLDAIRLANEENAVSYPPPRPVRALPPGRS